MLGRNALSAWQIVHSAAAMPAFPVLPDINSRYQVTSFLGCGTIGPQPRNNLQRNCGNSFVAVLAIWLTPRRG
jgi:hypothetical protein